jgi:hypothetical protein
MEFKAGDFSRIELALKKGESKGLHKAAEFLLGESRKRVPLEEGTLSASGKASVDDVALRAAVSYDTVYAVRQHEELTWRHDPGRTAKYLEAVFTEQQEMVANIIRAELKFGFGR